MIRARATASEMLHGELHSPLPAVSNVAWTRFVHVLTVDDDRRTPACRPVPRKFTTVSASGLGCFAMLPRRLVDIGVLKGVIIIKGKALADPKDSGLIAFLSDPIKQYKALTTSLRLYDLVMHTCPLPAGMTRSGMLALHHRLGPDALSKWAHHQEQSTIALYQRANGLF